MEIKSIAIDATKRVKRLRETIVNAPPRVCPERAVIITKSYQSYENYPILLKRANSLKDILEGISTPVYEDELIVGHYGSLRRSCPVFPEMSVQWLEDELDELSTREQDRFEITDDCKQKLKEIFPCWKNKTINDRIFAQLPNETKKARLEAGVFSVGAHEDTGLGHMIMDHKKILKKGFRAIIDELKEKDDSLDLSVPENARKSLFYQAGIICLEAGITWANRYGREAKRQAELEKDCDRRKELEKIADVCSRVPEYPARDFHEALQCIWFVQLLPQIETDGAAVTVGRLDQFALPYYQNSIKRGDDREHLQELLDCFWLKFGEMVKLYKLSTAQLLAGFPMGENIIVGGIDTEGNEAINELSYMCLDAHRHCRLYEPNFSVRVSTVTSDRFLGRVCENLIMGTGHPVVFNEKVGIQSLTAKGIPIKEARDYAPIGCVENSIADMWMRANGGYMSLGKIIELAVTGGVCQLTGKQVGPKTIPLDKMKSFHELKEAYKIQMEYFTKHLVIENNVIDQVNQDIMPIPLVSVLYDSCIESGRDVTEGGARYNFTCPGAVGVANAGDSLEVIKKLVFDEKRIAAKDLLDAMASDYEKAPELRRMVMEDAPKYGNDVEEVDLLCQWGLNVFLDELDKYSNPRGGVYTAGLTAITSNISFGKTVGALPDGKLATKPLAEGASPMMGNDRNGPTASMRSVARLDHDRLMKGVIYNQKFNSSVLSSREGIIKFGQMIKGYFDLDGPQVQFNVVSRETLIDAREHPENYRDMVVRVAGYSAFYTELSREVQDLIIKRTEFEAVG